MTSCYDDSSKVLDLTLVLDSTGSVKYLNRSQLDSLSASIISQLSIGPSAIQVAVIIYGTDANVAFHFGHEQSTSDLLDAIWTLARQVGSRKNLNKALNLLWSDVYAPRKGSRSGVNRIAVIITDGEDTEDTNLTLSNASKCKDDNNIRLMVLSASTTVSLPRLRSVASPGTVNYLRVADYQQLVGVLASYVGSVDHCQTTGTNEIPISSTVSVSQTTSSVSSTSPKSTTSLPTGECKEFVYILVAN